MTKNNTQQLAYALLNQYSQRFELKFGRKPSINRYREKWGFIDMLESIGYDRSIEVIKFYFETQRSDYSTQGLFNTFDKLDVAITERDDDRTRRAEIRRLTESRVREWEEKHESRSTGDQRSMR